MLEPHIVVKQHEDYPLEQVYVSETVLRQMEYGEEFMGAYRMMPGTKGL